ncbi:hypothetical protein MSG28_000603 [Choristoneura fumiferana]|uniref:Uncharacterized protein n=1 Tax=Choristoneura fumiferana TaxID=7141 RepID=A0ACC0K1Q3_CHOFU|nr:hypothetical protein MSG28_000603 [Choristoneura fumiferana]
MGPWSAGMRAFIELIETSLRRPQSWRLPLPANFSDCTERRFYRDEDELSYRRTRDIQDDLMKARRYEMKAQDYQADILKGLVKFKKKDWTFQQDSAPPHKAKLTQKWLMENLPGFISTDEWPSSSSDLNSLDPDTQWREAKIAENKDQLEKIQRELRWLTIQNDDGIGIGI